MQKITHGSFLSRKPETLAKVAEMVKTVANPNGSRSSRNFVFTAISPDEKQKPSTPRPPPVLGVLPSFHFCFLGLCLRGVDALFVWASVGYPVSRNFQDQLDDPGK